MARLQLEMALDFVERKEVENGQYTYRHNGKWYLVKYGPKYHNVYLVTEFSPEELARMERMEIKEGELTQCPKDQENTSGS